jgi:hypothetical protein
MRPDLTTTRPEPATAHGMRNWLAITSLAGIMIAVTSRAGAGGVVNPPYEIGTWRGFRAAAISYTFDDDCANQYAVAVPMFNAKGFKLTLFTVTSWVPGWTKVQNAASYGHEIASHTVTHPTLSGLTAAQQTNELSNSQSAINANVTNQKCVTLAYPNCVEGNEQITGTYYIAARGCSGQVVPKTPANFLNISSFVCGSLGSVQTLAHFITQANAAANANGWCVYLIHGIDNDGGYSPLPSATLQASVDYFSTNQSKYWVETFGNVVRYIRERNNASVTETTNSGDSITLQVTGPLDDSIYDYPITLRRPLPAGWPAAAASQGGHPLRAQLVTVNSTNYVMFDAVPDAGVVMLSKTALPPALADPVMDGSASLRFRLDGQAGLSYLIQSSSDLMNWAPVQTATLTSPSTNCIVQVSNTLQFYRALWAP